MTNDREQSRMIAPSECLTENCSGWRVLHFNALILSFGFDRLPGVVLKH
jgi:hypothetical protein